MKAKNIFLTLFLILLSSNLSAQANIKLPFVGERWFNFSGGSCCLKSITISKNGHCKIIGHEAPEWGNGKRVIYSGPFKNTIWIYENGVKSYGYKIDGRYITSLKSNGKPEFDCKEEGKPCTTLLE